MASSGGGTLWLQQIIHFCKADVASDVSGGNYPDRNFNCWAEEFAKETSKAPDTRCNGHPSKMKHSEIRVLTEFNIATFFLLVFHQCYADRDRI